MRMTLISLKNGGLAALLVALMSVMPLYAAGEAPVLDPIADQTAEEGVELTFTATATDPDAEAVVFSLGDPALPGAAIDPTTGVFTWTPGEADGGETYTVNVVVSDTSEPILTDEQLVSITVEEVNVAPQLDAVGDQTVTVGQLLSFTATATDSDLPAQTLAFSLADGAAGAIPTGASITAGGAFTWTPSAGQVGDHTFDVVVIDDGTPALSDFETITVTVSAVPPGDNLLTNAGFEDAVEGKPKRALGWQVTKLVTADGRICNVQRDGKPPLVYARTGECAFRFKLTRARARFVQQTLASPGLTAGQTLTVAGFIDTDRLNTGARIQALITYADNTKATLNVAIPRGTQPYRRVQNALTLTKDVSKIVLRLTTGASKGTLLIDDLYLTTGSLPPLAGALSNVNTPNAVPAELPPAADLRGN
jgi:hypothetical protein